jgi:DNA replication protein DnaC
MRRELPAEVGLARMLEAESAERQVRSLRYPRGAAKFPLPRDLDTFEVAESPVEEARRRAWATAQFSDAQHHVILVGGTGKTHWAIALARAALRLGNRARFFQEQTQGQAGRLARRLVGLDAVILDELGYRPFSPKGGALLFASDQPAL